MSLKNKILSVFLLCILLAFLPLLAIMQYHIRPMNMERQRHQTLQLIESKAQEVGSWLNQRISEIRIIHEYPPCKALDFARIKPYLTNLNLVLKKDYGNAQETFAIGGLDGRGWINDDITIDVSTRPYFQEAMAGTAEYVISAPVLSKSDENPIFLLCYPIRDSSGQKIGFINGAVNLKLVAEITENIDLYGGSSWIMSREGEAYTASNQILDTQLAAGDLAAIARQATQPAGLLDMKTITGADSTTFYSRVPYAQDWLLCTLIKNERMDAATQQIINLLLTVCAVLLVITATLALLISRSITRPVEQLKQHMLQLSGGDLQAYYPQDGKDEISVLGSVFNEMVTALQSLMERVRQVEAQKRRAELMALQAQINPHFLYNTLDTIQWKALHYKAYEVADMIQLLSRFFRISLSSGKEYITVGEELEQVTSYLQIQEIRYRDRLSYTIQAEEALLCWLVPKLIIQPLVENAIYHGIKPKDGPGRLEIGLAAAEGRLHITVGDDGVGMSLQRLEEVRESLTGPGGQEHYGMFNVNERLRLAYGAGYTMEIDSRPGGGTRIALQIPMTKKEETAHAASTDSR